MLAQWPTMLHWVTALIAISDGDQLLIMARSSIINHFVKWSRQALEILLSCDVVDECYAVDRLVWVHLWHQRRSRLNQSQSWASRRSVSCCTCFLAWSVHTAVFLVGCSKVCLWHRVSSWDLWTWMHWAHVGWSGFLQTVMLVSSRKNALRKTQSG